MKVLLLALCLTFNLTSGNAWSQSSAHAHHDAAPPAQKAWGVAGNPAAVRRTVSISMSDAMRFDPARIAVKQGDTIRFVLVNTGALAHEMVLGTPKSLGEHAAAMAKSTHMEHEAADAAQVAAGKTGELLWTFNRAGEFEFACMVAGHYQAGMRGKIIVTKS